ncbi:MAG TPA: FAD-dependent oxidoreductase, partial [Symbiobacteriaceae bacterium]|nr:FAD-dependent oxidoreductase [Symbiobacteriaceae bacterium]
MKRKLAVVIGGSMAGCMAARVLAGQFERVLVIERDVLPAGPELRKGAPQGAHTHALLLRGLQTMERLFPGLTADLTEAGAILADATADFAWYQHGVFKGRWQSGRPPMISMTRPLLEWKLRSRLEAVPNVAILPGTRVLSLITTADRSRVTGVRVEPVDESAPAHEVAADLVVDASGRGTRAPQWLEELGYPSVPMTEMKTD